MVVVSRWWMVCAVCSAPSLSTPAQSEPPPPSDSANQLRFLFKSFPPLCYKFGSIGFIGS